MRWITKRGKRLAVGIVLAGVLVACTTSQDNGSSSGAAESEAHALEGDASWYGEKFHGKRTASGKRYDMFSYTAAHRTLPFGTKVRVRNLENGRSVVVVITDRGPFVEGRVIDLSYIAARKLKMMRDGIVPVRLEVLQ